jgi:aminoglycoside/choline kinase family phosphotransferase
MISLRPEIERFLYAVCPGAEATAIVGDASTRRFYRIRMPSGETHVLVDYGLPFEGETDDVRLARIFREANLRVAQIHEVCGPAGCLLVEDLGDTRLETAVGEATWGTALALLERAVILAAQVAVRGTPVLARSERRDGPTLDAERFRFEMDFFVEHYVGGLRGCDPPPSGLREALHALADRAATSPRHVLCHRDFHSRNLMLRPDDSLAMVDIQDARWGPDSYDLASILRDGYIEIEDAWHDPLVELYCSTLDRPPVEGFRARLDHVAAQRMIKALGTFGYQASVRKDARYLDPIPRTQRRLRDLLSDVPDLHPLHHLLTTTELLTPPPKR